MKTLLLNLQKDSIYHNAVASVLRTVIRLNLLHAKDGTEYIGESQAVIKAIMGRIENEPKYEFLAPYVADVMDFFNSRSDLATEMFYINKQLDGVSYVMLNRIAPLKRATIPMTKAEFMKLESGKMQSVMNLLYEVAFSCFHVENKKDDCKSKYPNFSSLTLSMLEIFEPLYTHFEKYVLVLNSSGTETLMDAKSYMDEISDSREEVGMFLTLMCSCLRNWIKDAMDGEISDEELDSLIMNQKLGKFKDLHPIMKNYIKENLC